MTEWTKDTSKFSQMYSEARTAVNMWRNTGTLTKIGKFKDKPKLCTICNEKATSAEHLVNKAHGGNHTKHNVILVCSKHKKPSNSPKHWKEIYSVSDVEIIEKKTTTDENLRMNPHAAINDIMYKDLHDKVKATVDQWRKENGYD